MSQDSSNNESRADREEPTGAPVVRGDPQITGERAQEAIAFDPSDPESVEKAVEVVREFYDDPDAQSDQLFVLRGAAACAALVRGEGSYQTAAERADVTVNFLRKWARIHDLPISIRRYIALGRIVPSAAKHIARVDGEARFLLAWATLDHDLTVQEIRRLVSEINQESSARDVLIRNDVMPGERSVSIPIDSYHKLRSQAAKECREIDDIIAEAITFWLDEQE